MMKVKCLLCEGSVPSDDYEVQVEHTLSWHKATSKDEAERMVRSHFVNYYEEELPERILPRHIVRRPQVKYSQKEN
jgi:hypothetical protein